MSKLPTGIVTFILTDVEGSTRLWEAHPGAMRKAVSRHHEIVHQAIERTGGVRPQDQGEGDSVVGAFAKATDAIACALDIQLMLLKEPWPEEAPIRVRIGIHAGEIELRDERNYYGPTINRCARIRAIAHGGQTLVSRATEQLLHQSLPTGSHLRDLGPQRLKDLSEPEHVFQLCHPDLVDEFPPPRSMQVLPNNLPVQLTSFVGRDPEMAEVGTLLTTSRLVTLAGAAGCGKTRLALQVAAEKIDEFEDGAWFVDLAPVTDPALVPHTTADAIGVKEEPRRSILETLIEYVRKRRILLLLDNCEHVLSACTDLAADLLKSCPNLVIMTTSREPLGVPGETSWRVPSLPIPDAAHSRTLDELTQFDSARLFLDRALARSPDLQLDTNEAAAVGQICRRLDGIPLAIELAAAHTDVLTCEQIDSMLDDHFRILTGGARTALERQQTMLAAVGWSYDLLTEHEQVLLRRLSVFVGGFTLEATEEICAGGPFDTPQIFGLLSSLVRKSLVVSEKRPHAARYRLLETIRQYARDRLHESGEGAPLRTRHRDWYLALAERAAPELLQGGKQAEWLELLEEEHDNLRAALEWSAADADPQPVARLASALDLFWRIRGYAGEGRRWLSQALERSDVLPPALRAEALTSAGLLAWAHHDHKAARPFLDEALSIGRSTSDESGMAQTLHVLGNVAISLGDSNEARTFWEESLEIRQRLGDQRGAGSILHNLAALAYAAGDLDGARQSFEDALAINREVGNRYGEAVTLLNLGELSLQQAEYAPARVRFEEALAIARELGARNEMVHNLGILGDIDFIQGHYEAALNRWEEAAQHAHEMEWVEAETHIRGALAYLAGNYEEGKLLYEKSAAVSRESGEENRVAESVLWAAYCAEAEGGLVEARSHFEESLSILRPLAGHGGSDALNGLGRLARAEGDYRQAEALHCESLPLSQKLGDSKELASALEGLGAAAAGLVEFERAARLYGAAEHLREVIGAVIYPHLRAAHEASVESVKAAMSAEAFQAAWEAGRSMSLEESIEYASKQDS